ncbi:hypothetical protein ASG90_07400 [Nocardioides sp. Soil797]|nr:hypothetical protein ASG90_07400 [Nocardioides sp. Soil797]
MKILVPALVVALLTLTGCDESTGRGSDDTPTEGITEVSTPESRLLDARQAWRNSGIASYQWRYERFCYCPEVKMAIEVVDGRAVGVQNAARGGDPSDPTVKTMEDLFDAVEAALRDADEVHVTYDPQTGAVRRLSVDHVENAIDDEYSYLVKRVDPLP